ncbi:MAG TPA: polymer-forming cytoskeletal protein [Vicinamibacterales bacterium]
MATRILLVAAFALTLHAQPSGDVSELRDRLRERYDVVALQNGIGLVPRQPDARVSIIQIRDGAVTINGQELTGGELRERLGADADLVLRASYLGAAQQRQLAAAEPAPPSPRAAAPEQPANTEPRPIRRQGEIVRVGGDVRVERDERIEDDVVAVFGSAQVDGEVDGDVAVVGGSLTLGPEAVVHGDVNVIGGTLTRAATARIEGEVHNVGVGGGPWRFGAFGDVMRRAFVWRIGGLVGTLLRVALLALLALVVVAFGPGVVERIADRAAVDPLRAGLIGFCAELLFVPVVVITVVVLAVSIIGIPLLVLVPFGIVLALVVLLVGFTGVAYQVGRMLHGRFGWAERGAYACVILGVLVIGGLTILARSAALLGGDLFGFPLAALGLCVEYAAWTIGFGAAILVWLRGRRPELRVPALP